MHSSRRRGRNRKGPLSPPISILQSACNPGTRTGGRSWKARRPATPIASTSSRAGNARRSAGPVAPARFSAFPPRGFGFGCAENVAAGDICLPHVEAGPCNAGAELFRPRALRLTRSSRAAATAAVVRPPSVRSPLSAVWMILLAMCRRARCFSLPVDRTAQARSSAVSILARVRRSKLSEIMSARFPAQFYGPVIAGKESLPVARPGNVSFDTVLTFFGEPLWQKRTAG